jgi:hypothetical protein
MIYSEAHDFGGSQVDRGPALVVRTPIRVAKTEEFYGKEEIQDISKNKYCISRCRLLMLVILAAQEAEIRRITVQSQPREIVHKTLSKIPITKTGLVEWLKV